jgi:hypothetical protein
MEFKSWKYHLILFKSYTYKRTEKTCPGFKPTRHMI